ncbi:hypoxanthine phosphoribosyltransferase [Eubacteriaceae bacterium ES3]|nr:hypoxanthine phosphoribosyltransferase [Eubacteriaceae bacterium ES3]
MRADIQEVLVDEAALKKRISEMGQELTEVYQDKNPLLIGVLKGSAIFMADLIREMDVIMEIDFLKASSYGNEARSCGTVKLEHDISMEVKDRYILLVEDIIDTGNTLKFLMDSFKTMGAKDVKVCSLLDKPERREQHVTADYIGFDIPNEFVVGYGLDFAQKYRNLPYIGILKKEVYE